MADETEFAGTFQPIVAQPTLRVIEGGAGAVAPSAAPHRNRFTAGESLARDALNRTA